MKDQIVLNDNGTADWNCSKIGRDGTMYSGPFRFKTSMSPLALIAADRDYRALLGPQAALASDVVANMAFALAQLKQRIVSAPPFWVEGNPEYGGGHAQYEVVQEVLNAAIAAQEKHEDMLGKRSAQMAEKIRANLEQYAKEQKERAEKEEKEDKGLDGAAEAAEAKTE